MDIDIGEKEKREILGFIFEWISGQIKRSEIEKLDKATINILIEAMIGPPKWFVKATAVGDETFDRIHALVKKSFKEKEVKNELEKIYDERKIESLHYINRLININEERAFGSLKAQQLRVLRQKPEMKEVMQKLEQSAWQTAQSRPNRREALQNLDHLLQAKTWVEFRSLPFSNLDFGRKEDGEAPILEIGYKIWKPHFWYPLYQYEDEYKDFPLKWLGFKLSVWSYEYLYQRWKEGDDLTPILESFYDGEDAFKTMIDKCRFNYIGFKRVPLLNEIIGNYRDQRYASVVTLALTQVEGIIWDLAVFLHNNRVERIFDYEEKVSYIDYQVHKLLNEKGELIKTKPTVGLLIRHTAMKNYLYAPFLDYCTEELFRERNPILHGRITNFGNKLEANKKLLTLEMVVSTLHSVLVDHADLFLQKVLGEHFEEFQKSLHSGNPKDVITTLNRLFSLRKQADTNKEPPEK